MNKKKPPSPRNIAALALQSDVFRQRRLKNKKTYTRKVKHSKKGRHFADVPFLCPQVDKICA